ncbi:TPA: hypothetical protein KQG29_002821 [Clostridioides difficile]|nr:hypothetical protein [Clostridioides difficile]
MQIYGYLKKRDKTSSTLFKCSTSSNAIPSLDDGIVFDGVEDAFKNMINKSCI